MKVWRYSMPRIYIMYRTGYFGGPTLAVLLEYGLLGIEHCIIFFRKALQKYVESIT